MFHGHMQISNYFTEVFFFLSKKTKTHTKKDNQPTNQKICLTLGVLEMVAESVLSSNIL